MWEFAVLGMAAVVQSGPAAPAQVDWRWQADSEGCVLRQQLEAQGTQFEISRTPGNDRTTITLLDRQGAPRDWKPVEAVAISVDTSGEVRADGFVGPAEKPNSRTIALTITNGDVLGELSGASTLTLSNSRLGTVRVTPRSIGAAVKALAECEDRKMRKWGIDPISWRALPVKPVPKTPPATWINWFDYPDRAKSYRNDIIVVARLDLDADGSVQNCQVVNLPPAEFREAACTALRRNARLQPARDELGMGTPAPYILQIRFGAFKL